MQEEQEFTPVEPHSTAAIFASAKHAAKPDAAPGGEAPGGGTNAAPDNGDADADAVVETDMPAEAGAAGEASAAGLTHIDAQGRANMVDVGEKPDTDREALVEGHIFMKRSTLDMIADGGTPKGDVLAVARVAGIMAAKRTSDIIPLCHPLNLTHVGIDMEPLYGTDQGERCGIRVLASCSVNGKTGIEMEALTAASVACLTIYDMCKAVDRGMEIGPIRLMWKAGGKSGVWER